MKDDKRKIIENVSKFSSQFSLNKIRSGIFLKQTASDLLSLLNALEDIYIYILWLRWFHHIFYINKKKPLPNNFSSHTHLKGVAVFILYFISLYFIIILYGVFFYIILFIFIFIFSGVRCIGGNSPHPSHNSWFIFYFYHHWINIDILLYLRFSYFFVCCIFLSVEWSNTRRLNEDVC